MPNKSFNINTNEFVIYTNKLEKLKRSDLPLAIRGTLNDLAFDMKIKQVPRQFAGAFIVRKKKFIQSHTTAMKSKNTFDIKSMTSTVGIIGGKSDSGDQLDKQEFGGRVSRDEIPTKESRISKSKRKLVSKPHYLKNIEAVKGNNFRKAALRAGKGGFIKYGNVIYKIQAIQKKSRSGLFIKSLPVYHVKKGRTIRIERKPFMEPAANISLRKAPSIYKKRAEQRIAKYYS